MKSTKLLSITLGFVLLINLTGCGNGNSPLSIALNPYTGNNKLYEEWADKGFDYSNNYFGIKIYKVAGAQTYIDSGKWKTYQLFTDEPRGKVREAVSRACNRPETDFKKAGGEGNELVIDEGTHKLTCYFGPGNESGTYTVLILRSPKTKNN